MFDNAKIEVNEEQKVLRKLWEDCHKDDSAAFRIYAIKMEDGTYERLHVLNPNVLDQEKRDAIVRYAQGDQIADAMLRNRAFYDQVAKEFGNVGEETR